MKIKIPETRNHLATDEVCSCLQKSIRRAMSEEACRYAYEMYTTAPEMLEQLWSRLLVISVEDIGMGNKNMAIYMYVLNEMRKQYAYEDADQPMFFIHAIRLLCESQKDRSSDLLKNIIIKTAAMGQVPEIMDIALDKHTRRGRSMGRDSFHFLHEASKVIPQMEVDNDYKERYEKILEIWDPEKAVDVFPYKKGGMLDDNKTES